MADHPFVDVIRQISDLVADDCLCFQKFTCCKCGQRLTVHQPNSFYTHGSCDKCGEITDIEKAGCNYMLITGGKALVAKGVFPAPLHAGRITLIRSDPLKFHEGTKVKQ